MSYEEEEVLCYVHYICIPVKYIHTCTHTDLLGVLRVVVV